MSLDQLNPDQVLRLVSLFGRLDKLMQERRELRAVIREELTLILAERSAQR